MYFQDRISKDCKSMVTTG